MKAKAQDKNNVSSPCTRQCCLNEIDICIGCFRHIDEIVSWSSYQDKEKLQILDSCHKRAFHRK